MVWIALRQHKITKQCTLNERKKRERERKEERKKREGGRKGGREEAQYRVPQKETERDI